MSRVNPNSDDGASQSRWVVDANDHQMREPLPLYFAKCADPDARWDSDRKTCGKCPGHYGNVNHVAIH